MLLLRCCVHAAYVERKKAKEVSSKKAPYTNQQTDGMNKIVIDIFACETLLLLFTLKIIRITITMHSHTS